MKWLATITAVTIVGLCFLYQAVTEHYSYEKQEASPPGAAIKSWRDKSTTSIGWPMVYMEDVQEDTWTGEVMVDCLSYHPMKVKSQWALLVNPLLALVAMAGAALAVNTYFASRPYWYRFRLYEVLIAIAVASAALGSERAGLTTWGQLPIWPAWATAAVLIPWRTISLLRNRYTRVPLTYFGPTAAKTR